MTGERADAGAGGRVLISALDPAEVALEVEALAAQGWTAFLLRPGGRLTQRLGAARWAAGPRASIGVDLGGSPAAGLPVLLASIAHLRPEIVNAAEGTEEAGRGELR